MNIALIGYGKMGKEMVRAAQSKSISIQSIIHPNSKEPKFRKIDEESLKGVDVCIDFTTPDSVVNNIRAIAELKKDIVVGTTGWDDRIDEVKEIIEANNIGFIYASNFSVGVNIFFNILEAAAKLINKVEDYDVFVYEMHHKNKLDSPSGTAKTIREILLKNIDRKTKLDIASVRAGTIPGTHVVGFDSKADLIELKHTARSREGFALGAILAAQWICNKKGFYTMEDMMKNV